MTTYMEFNKDVFLCNNLNKSAYDCKNHPINKKCNSKDETCEICKNFAYKDWYIQNHSKSNSYVANHDDSKNEYFRTWIQSCNLGIGIIFLCFGIYYQQSSH